MVNQNVMDVFQVNDGRATVWTDSKVFYDKTANAPFRTESFNEVLEILRAAGFKFVKNYSTLDDDIQNIWVFDTFNENDKVAKELPESAIEAIIRAAAACGIRQGEILMGIRERQVAKKMGLDKIEVKSSESQIIQTAKLIEDASKI